MQKTTNVCRRPSSIEVIKLTYLTILKAIPLDKYDITKPVFFAAATNDYICLSAFGKTIVDKHCKNATIREFDAGHWVLLSHADELNGELEAWIDNVRTGN